MFEITVYIQHRIYAQADSNRELYTEAAVKDSDNVCIGVAGFFFTARLYGTLARVLAVVVCLLCARVCQSHAVVSKRLRGSS